jgi:hypothetical protein
MGATFIRWIRAISVYVASGMRILGAACTVYSDDHDQKPRNSAPKRRLEERRQSIAPRQLLPRSVEQPASRTGDFYDQKKGPSRHQRIQQYRNRAKNAGR